MKHHAAGSGSPPLRIAGIASHGGTNLRHIDRACRDGKVNATMAALISNNGDADILDYARDRGIPAWHLSRRTHPNPGQLDTAMLTALHDASVEIVFLSGYMRKLGPQTIARFHNHILNVHPALLPKFGGQGMYGDRVYEAVLSARETETGATVHIVDEEYDHGPVVLKYPVPVHPGDDVEALRTRVRQCEQQLCVDVIAGLAAGRILLEDIAEQFAQGDATERLVAASSSAA